MSEIQKIQPQPITTQPRQLPEGYALVRVKDLPQHPTWRNAPDPVSVQANAQSISLLKWCGMGLAGCVALAVLVNAFKPAPAPAPASIIIRPAPTPTPAPAGNNDSCLENCWSVF